MKEQVITKLSEYSQEEFNIFIKKLSFNEKLNFPIIIFGDNFAEIIFGIYRSILKFNRSLISNYFNACIYNLRCIDKVNYNSEIIYTYIYFIHEVRPFDFKRDIFKILQDNELKYLTYGSDNLEEMLLKALIQMEDKNDPILLERIVSSRNKGYYLYLYIYYFAYLGDKKNAFRRIGTILSSIKKLEVESYNFFYHSILDTVPEYLSIRELIKYLIFNNIIIFNNSILINTLNEVLKVFKKRYLDNNLYLYVLFLEDFFNRNMRNALMYPNYLDRLEILDFDIFSLVCEYYSTEKIYNSGVSLNYKEIANQVLKELSAAS